MFELFGTCLAVQTAPHTAPLRKSFQRFERHANFHIGTGLAIIIESKRRFAGLRHHTLMRAHGLESDDLGCAKQIGNACRNITDFGACSFRMPLHQQRIRIISTALLDLETWPQFPINP